MELAVFRTQPSSVWPLPAVLSGHVRNVQPRFQTLRWEEGTFHKWRQENVYKYDNFRVSVGLIWRVWNVITEARSVVEKNFQRSKWPASAAVGRVTMWTLSVCLQVNKTLKNPWSSPYKCFSDHQCPTTTTPEPCICPAVFDPVCGTNNVTYSNTCQASCEGGSEVACKVNTPKLVLS